MNISKGDWTKTTSAIDSVEKQTEFHRSEIVNLQRDTKQSLEWLEILDQQAKTAAIENALLKQQCESLQKQLDGWQSWARILVPWFLGILSAAIVGLFLLLVRKTP